MKKLLIIAAMTMATTAQASVPDEEQYCQWLGSLATGFALDRDAGDTLEDAYDEVHRSINNGLDADTATDAYSIADFVYRYPRLLPNEEGNAIYEWCWEERL